MFPGPLTLVHQLLYVLLHVQWFKGRLVSFFGTSSMVDQKFREVPRDVCGANWRIEKIAWVTNLGARIWTRGLQEVRS